MERPDNRARDASSKGNGKQLFIHMQLCGIALFKLIGAFRKIRFVIEDIKPSAILKNAVRNALDGDFILRRGIFIAKRRRGQALQKTQLPFYPRRFFNFFIKPAFKKSTHSFGAYRFRLLFRKELQRGKTTQFLLRVFLCFIKFAELHNVCSAVPLAAPEREPLCGAAEKSSFLRISP